MDCLGPFALVQYALRPGLVSDQCQDVLGELTFQPDITWRIYLAAFTLTCLFEAPVYAYCFRASRRWLGPAASAQRWTTQMGMIFTVNLCTHPLVVFGLPAMMAAGQRPFGTSLLSGEVLAPLLEALLLKMVFHVPWRRAALGALAANLWSWSLGGMVSASGLFW